LSPTLYNLIEKQCLKRLRWPFIFLFGNFGNTANVIIGGMLSLVGFSVIPKCIVRFSLR